MCGPCKCSECYESFKNSVEFDNHECIIDFDNMSDKELLEGLYKSGRCSKEHYESEIKKLNKEYI